MSDEEEETEDEEFEEGEVEDNREEDNEQTEEDEESEVQINNVVGSVDLGREIDIQGATEEFDDVEGDWAGRTWRLDGGTIGTALIWESGSVVVVGGATTEADVDDIVDEVEDRLADAGLLGA